MTDPPLVGIIIVNWNGWRDTIECLESIENISYSNYFVHIVDNGSTDDSIKELNLWRKGRESWVTIIPLDHNGGFASGCNQGMQQGLDGGAQFLLLLNNDTVVHPDFLGELVKYASLPGGGRIMGGQIHYYRAEERIWYDGGELRWSIGGGIHWSKGKSIDRERTLREASSVTFITGCLMLIHHSVIEEIGYLDESYFLYCEDTDFCARAVKQNIPLGYTPSAIIYHKENSTLSGWQKDHIYYLIRNRVLFMEKNAPTPTLLLFFLLAPLAGILLLFWWVGNRRFDLIDATLKGGIDGIKGRGGKRPLGRKT